MSTQSYPSTVTVEPPPSGQSKQALSGFMTQTELAKLLKVSIKTLQRMHAARRGPPRVRVGHSIFYRIEAMEEWMVSREIRPVDLHHTTHTRNRRR